MTTERRTNIRGKDASRVTFTDAASDTPTEGKLHDIGRGGMFVATASKLGVGKRIEFEIHLSPAPAIAGMGRVLWTREEPVGDLPAGIGVKFIDVDNDALVAIDRIVGLKKNVRERTILGMAAPTLPAAILPKSVETKGETPKPTVRERTMLGMAPPGPPREKELSWPEEPPEPPPEPAASPKPELVVAEPKPDVEVEPLKPEPEPIKPEPEPIKPEPEPIKPAPTVHAAELEPEPKPAPAPEPEPAKGVVAEAKAQAPAPARKQEVSQPVTPRELPAREGGRGWMLAVLLLVGIGVAVFMLRDRIGSVLGPAPAMTTTPSATLTPPPPRPSVSAQPSAIESAPPTVSAFVPPVETLEAGVTALEEADAGAHDGGIHDAGHHHHDAGVHAHPHPHPSAAATGNDNPY